MKRFHRSIFAFRLITIAVYFIAIWFLYRSAEEIFEPQKIYKLSRLQLGCDYENPAYFHSEGDHYPNQTFFNEILSRTPQESIRLYPQISSNTPIIIVSLSTPGDRVTRDEIRRTWANRKNYLIMNNEISVMFLVGDDSELWEQLLDEHLYHKDLLVVRNRDSYRGLVYKLLMAYTFISWKYPKAHVVKADGDVLLDLKRLHDFVNKQVAEDFIIGPINEHIKVQREKGHRWFVPKDFFDGEYYPVYAQGMFYIISNTAMTKLLAVARHAKVVEVEDVFFTGFLRLRAELEVSDLELFERIPEDFPGCKQKRSSELIGLFTCGHIEERHYEWMMFRAMNLCKFYEQ